MRRRGVGQKENQVNDPGVKNPITYYYMYYVNLI